MNTKATPLSLKERKHIATIQRRIDYLSAQVGNRDNLARQVGAINAMDYTRRELAALNWAVSQLQGES